MTVREIRAQILTALGGKCVKCGFSDYRALDVDHIYGDGARVRRNYKGLAYYQLLLRDLWMGGLQALCANCHRIKTCEQLENTGRRKFDLEDLLDGDIGDLEFHEFQED